ncbi:MAG: hypothetical protein JWO69_978 [Thermoleophilia bacterium]|nr:hypothetical protein [Thermoleophilia bacterium]
MPVRNDLIAVAFHHGTGGQLRVLLAVDRDGDPMYDGEPAIMATHRPGDDPSRMELEGAEAVPSEFVSELGVAVGQLAAVLEAAFERDGSFSGARLVGQVVTVEVPAHVV